jgi:GDP-D-mannose 3',5'-epimerase
MKKILVCGAGGFIGTHLVTSLKSQGHYVIGVDLKYPEFSCTDADEFYICDLRIWDNVEDIISKNFDEIYQLAADMGGAGYIFTGAHDANIMHNSAQINLNILELMVRKKITKIFYSSSACIYPMHCQTDPEKVNLAESVAYPAWPDSEYGWEKLFSERLYLSYAKNHQLDVRIARLHNVFGPLGSWNNGREKAPAALCRKVAENDIVEVWGPGTQTRSFLYIDECIKGIQLIMNSSYPNPLNLGSDRCISINNLVQLIGAIANKTVVIKNIPGPVGVAGRVSNNTLIKEKIGWLPENNLEYGLEQTYNWIFKQINRNKHFVK